MAPVAMVLCASAAGDHRTPENETMTARTSRILIGTFEAGPDSLHFSAGRFFPLAPPGSAPFFQLNRGLRPRGIRIRCPRFSHELSKIVGANILFDSLPPPHPEEQICDSPARVARRPH